MNLKGKFEVTLLNQKTFETKVVKGENLITNIGKNYLKTWLMHNVSADAVYTNERVISNSIKESESIYEEEFEITAKNYWDSYSSAYKSEKPTNCLTDDLENYSLVYNSYQFNDSELKYKRESSIYFNFSTPRKIKKIIMVCHPTNSSGTSNGGYDCQLEISTSPFDSGENKDWTVRKYIKIPKYWNLETKSPYDFDKENISELPIYLGDRNDPEKAIENVRCIRISPRYGLKIYKIKFIEEVDYPTPPCFIGLGTSEITPDAKDTDLGNRIATLFSKCTYKEENDYKIPSVTYETTLGLREFNGKKFTEIGLFCVEDKILPYKGQKLNLFSHGLFETAWEKNPDVVAHIKYVLIPNVEKEFYETKNVLPVRESYVLEFKVDIKNTGEEI